MKFMQMIYRSQRNNDIGELMAVYTDNITEHRNALSEQNIVIFNVRLC
jgi:hypothetical protein